MKKKRRKEIPRPHTEINEKDWDFFLFSGPIYPEKDSLSRLIAAVFRDNRTPRPNISLLISTYGGDPHEAFRIARFLGRVYKRVRVVVAGQCKSAGSLITLGAHEISFSPLGELGPLDVQLSKKDDLFFLSSGLDTLQAFSLVTGFAFSTFESYMLQLVEKSGGLISTKTACDVAGTLTTGLFAPLMQQIDPNRLSEVQRMLTIAKDYGERLECGNLKPNGLERLIEGYPSHGFIIDLEEASTLFEHVDHSSGLELEGSLAAQDRWGCVREPSPDTIVYDVWPLVGAKTAAGPTDEAAQREGANDEQPPPPGGTDSPQPNEGGEPPNAEPRPRPDRPRDRTQRRPAKAGLRQRPGTDTKDPRSRPETSSD